MAPKVEYKEVVFYDGQNGKSSQKSLEVGSRISLTTSIYDIKEDGIYKDGQKQQGNKVEVTLPQITTINLWDANEDGKIDGVDAGIFDAQADPSNTAGDDRMGNLINNSLAKKGSSYEVAFTGGHHASADIDSDGAYSFHAMFRNKGNADDTKSIRISSEKSLEKDAESQARDEALQDRKYKREHPIRNFFGITREQYEQNK